MEPEQNPNSNSQLGWRVVVASLLLPLAWVATNSVALTMMVGGFSALLLAQSHPEIAALTNESLPFRWINAVAPFVVLLIFIGALLRTVLR